MKQRTACVIMAMVLLLGCGRGRPDARKEELPPSPRSEFSKEEHKVTIREHRSGEWSPGLSDDEKSTLYAIAWDTLRWCVRENRGQFSFDKYAITPKLREDTATFVTLKTGGMLRGCIGSLAPVEALFASVHDNAVNAATRDPRFRPVTVQELDGIDLHISILSPISDIDSILEFKIGQHGIIIEKGACRAVYLPEVAMEQKWTVEETLSSLSQKAGMGPDAWRKGARFKVFSSVVLSQDA